MSLTPPTGDEIKAFRQATGLSQADLAQAIGGSKRGIEDWESGRRTPPAMLRLAMGAINEGVKPWTATPDPIELMKSAERAFRDTP